MAKSRAFGCVIAAIATLGCAFGQTSGRQAGKPGEKTIETPGKVVRPRTTQDDIDDAIAILKAQASVAGEFLLKGDVDGASKLVLETFPEATRTPAQSFVMGQAIFRNDPKLSYSLIKSAAKKLPDSAEVLLAWGLEQHREREYEGALQAYERADELRPGNAPVLAVAAECALRIGNVEKALALWKSCGEATRGTQEDIESLVCEVNDRRRPMGRRAELVKKVLNANELAAADLLLLDCDWPSDWWNKGPNRQFLENDLLTVGKWILPGGNVQVQEAKCVGALAMMERPTKEKVYDLLRRSRYLIDEQATMPTNARAAVQMLRYAIRSGATTRDDARVKLGPQFVEMAKNSGLKDAFEAAGFLYFQTGKADEIDRLGWEVAKDPRCAAGVLAAMVEKKELKWESPELQKAIKDFPESAAIAGIALKAGVEAGQPKRDLLIRAILAEYSGFSLSDRGGTVRPRSDALRDLWQQLAELKE
ncbi:MAG: tetratricopeptide repeat protein [Phycisphaeraceae bacterium]|nr:tetratricopeptide repeat protein [Phycisphaeraceae bacterium]